MSRRFIHHRGTERTECGMLRATQGSPLRNSRVLRCDCVFVVKKSRTSYDNAQSPPGARISHHKNLCALCASVVKKLRPIPARIAPIDFPTTKNLCALCASVVCTSPDKAPFPLTESATPKNLCALCVSVVKKDPYQPQHRAIPTDLESAPPHHKKSLCPLCLCGEKILYHPRQCAIFPKKWTGLVLLKNLRSNAGDPYH